MIARKKQPDRFGNQPGHYHFMNKITFYLEMLRYYMRVTYPLTLTVSNNFLTIVAVSTPSASALNEVTIR